MLFAHYKELSRGGGLFSPTSQSEKAQHFKIMFHMEYITTTKKEAVRATVLEIHRCQAF